MHKTYRYKPRGAVTARRAVVQLPLAVKGLALIFFLCVVVRVFSALGADSASKSLMSGLVADGRVVDGILSFELGSAAQSDENVTLLSRILGTSIFSDGATPEDMAEASISRPSAASENSDFSITDIGDIGLYFNNGEHSQGNIQANTPDTASPTPNIISKPAANTATDVIPVNNKTDYTVDTAALLKEPMKLKLSGDGPLVLIIHSHGSEAYMPDGADQYVESDAYRTQDKSQSVIRVGDELAAELTKKGFSVVHDRNFYDYPTYAGSYTRSCDAIKSYLKKYPNIKIVIDLHRDAIVDSAGNVYKTYAQVGNTTCSQVMFVMGTNDPKRPHPNWKENLKLALHIQQEMNQLYPSLSKPVELSTLRYNQQLTPGSMIVEVGSIGNTLQESLTAVRYFADAFSNVVKGLYK